MAKWRDLHTQFAPSSWFTVAAYDERRVIVSDLIGNCDLVDISGDETQHEEWLYRQKWLGSTAASSIAVDALGNCAWDAGQVAILWNPKDRRTELAPEGNGPVHRVAFSSNGNLLAIGLGYYPLNPANHSMAAVEIWGLVGTPTTLAQAALPGVRPDQLRWTNDDQILYGCTGHRSQQQGYLFELDAISLRALRIVDLDFCWTIACQYVPDYEAYLLASRNHVEMRQITEYSRLWCWNADAELNAVHVDQQGGVAFTSLGQILDLENGRVVERLPPLPNCTSLTQLSNGDWVGVSTEGIIRIWQA